ncbi:MAG: EpsG family protein [Solobacterium sp.]|nr:EpsG family protein [Solobacterium sp.]
MGKERTIVKWWYAILVFAPLVIMAMNRSAAIGDTLVYIAGYRDMPSSFSGLPAYYNSLSKDKAYFMLAALIKCVFGSNYRIYFCIVAIIHAYAVIKIYRQYSPSFVMAVFLFVTSGDYISWMENGTRQFLAVAICLLATDFMLKKKYVPAVIMVLIASRFHQSALLVIPMIFIVQGKPWNKMTMLFIALALVAIAFVDQFTNFLDDALEATQYSNVVSEWKSWDDDGTNPIRVLIYSLPAILSLIGLRFIQAENDPLINFSTNMSIIATGLYLVSMVTSGIFIGRLPIYASLYSQGILLPWELDHMFNRSSAFLMKVFMVIAYIALYFYQFQTWGVI